MEVVSDILKQLKWSPAAKKALHNIVHERMQEAGLSPYTFSLMVSSSTALEKLII